MKAPPLKPSALEKHQAGLIQRLGALPLPPVLESLTTLKGITPTACLHISPAPPDKVPFMGLLQARLRFDYDGHRGWWAGQGNAVLITTPQGRALLERDSAAERDAIAQLFELGLRARDDGLFGIPLEGQQQDWLQWADHGFDVLIEAGFRVTSEDCTQRLDHPRRPHCRQAGARGRRGRNLALVRAVAGHGDRRPAPQHSAAAARA